VASLGDSNLKFDQGVLPVKNFRVECAGLWIGNLSVDKNGRLVLLSIPAQDLEVVRSDLLPGQEKGSSPVP